MARRGPPPEQLRDWREPPSLQRTVNEHFGLHPLDDGTYDHGHLYEGPGSAGEYMDRG